MALSKEQIIQASKKRDLVSIDGLGEVYMRRDGTDIASSVCDVNGDLLFTDEEVRELLDDELVSKLSDGVAAVAAAKAAKADALKVQ